jgi:hypothetical protein
MTWTYEATPHNEAVATSVGFLRQAPYLGQPERNRNYSEGDIWEAWQHQITALAEIAFAGMMGKTDFIPSYNTHKGEPDFDIWEVRYGFSDLDGNVPGLRFSEGVDSLDAPYVLIVGGPERKMKRSAANNYATPAFTALGWMWAHECVQPQFETMYSNPNRRKFLVPPNKLRSMDEIERAPKHELVEEISL